MDKIIALITNNIDFMAVALVLLGGIFAKHYLARWKADTAWKTLIVGSIFLIMYCLIQEATGKFNLKDTDKIFFSYCVATSLYELLLKYVFDLISQKLGVKEDAV